MKKIILSLVLLIATLTNTTFAQTAAPLKLGHINSADLLNAMPEWKQAQKDLETFKMQKEKDLQTKKESLETDYMKFQQDMGAGILSPAEQERKNKDFETRGLELEKELKKADADFSTKGKTLTEPILQRAEKAINDVATEGNYTYIFDTAPGSSGILFKRDSEDIYPAVRKKLGMQ